MENRTPSILSKLYGSYIETLKSIGETRNWNNTNIVNLTTFIREALNVIKD